MRYILARANRDVLRAVRLLARAAGLRLRRHARADRAPIRTGRRCARRTGACSLRWPQPTPASSSPAARAPTCGGGSAGACSSAVIGQPRHRAVARDAPRRAARSAAGFRSCGNGWRDPGRHDRRQGLLARRPLPPLAREGKARGDACWRRPAAARGATHRRQAGGERAARGRAAQGPGPGGASAPGRAATPRSTSATTRPTRTSSRSTSRAGCWRSASGRKRGSAAAYYIRSQAEIDRVAARLLAFRPRPVRERGGSGGEVKRCRPARREPARSVACRTSARRLEFMRLLWAVDHGLQRTLETDGGDARRDGSAAPRDPHRGTLSQASRPASSPQILHLHPSTLTGVLQAARAARAAHAAARSAGRPARRASGLRRGAAARRRRPQARSSPCGAARPVRRCPRERSGAARERAARAAARLQEPARSGGRT